MQELLQDFWGDLLGVLDYKYKNNIFNPELAALILCANEQNYKELLSLKSYKEFLKSDNFYEIKMLQIGVLNSIKDNLLNPNELCYYLEKLKDLKLKNSIFSYLSTAKQDDKIELSNHFIDEKNKLKDAYNELKNLLSADLKNKLDEFYKQLENKEFKIAFSGIFNAGKSSLINALLERDFLGVSNAPETANLSIISYGNENIKVNFYNESEFNALKTQASLNEELNKIFSVDFKAFKSVETNFNELYNYTSANSKMSIFVKDINIYLDNEYLKNNISIIDTPGLDDVVISREQASKEFLKKANCVLYLMSSTQALSIKDLDFLITYAKNNPNSKLVLALTKSDLISLDEQIKLKDYVKTRFNNELKKEDININYELFCLSVNDYKKDKKKGEINALKAHLNDVCFNSMSSYDFTKNIADKFINLIDLELHYLENINNSLLLDKNDFLEKIRQIKEENLKKIEEKNKLENNLNDYLSKKYSFNYYELKFLAKNQASRLFDELNYDKNYSNELAKRVIMQGFKDLLNASFSSMQNIILNDFNAIKENLDIKKDFKITFDKLALEEIFDELSSILDKFSLLDKENEIENKLNAIYTNINLNLFNFTDIKNNINSFLKEEFFNKYHIEEVKNTDFDNENLLNINIKKIEKLQEIKEKLK